MRGETVGAGGDGKLRRAHRIRILPAARIADGGGDVIDVDAETQGRHCGPDCHRHSPDDQGSA
jgi:hypothetical protein